MACGPDLGGLPDAGRAEQAHARADHRVLADRDTGLDPGGGGLQEGHAVVGVALEDPGLGHGLGLHQVGAVVHAERAAGVVGQVGDDALVALPENPDRGGEVALAALRPTVSSAATSASGSKA